MVNSTFLNKKLQNVKGLVEMNKKIVEVVRNWDRNVVELRFSDGEFVTYPVENGKIDVDIFRLLEIQEVANKNTIKVKRFV
jgi:hypothetical protein